MDKTLHRKLKIEKHEPTETNGVRFTQFVFFYINARSCFVLYRNVSVLDTLFALFPGLILGQYVFFFVVDFAILWT